MLQKETMQFLAGLAKNNDRAWMEKHKDEYKTAKEDVEMFAADLIARTMRFEDRITGLSPKETMFRLHRDVRFSKNKLPYKTHFGVVIGPRGRKSPEAMYYIHISPQEAFVAGGKWHPENEARDRIRKAIAKDSSGLRKILATKKFKELFGEMSGDQLKTSPRDYSKDHPDIDLLRYKDFLAVHHFSPTLLTKKEATAEIEKKFKAIKPFNDWLNEAMGF